MISRIFPSNHRCPPSVGASTCKAASRCRRRRCTAAAAAEQDLVGQAAGCDLIGACGSPREPWLGLGSGLDRCAVPATTQVVASVVFMPSSLFQWPVVCAIVPMRHCQGSARAPTPDISLLSAPCSRCRDLRGCPAQLRLFPYCCAAPGPCHRPALRERSCTMAKPGAGAAPRSKRRRAEQEEDADVLAQRLAAYGERRRMAWARAAFPLAFGQWHGPCRCLACLESG